ncbi:MAG TPA: hypothetical protein PKL82_05355 [Anaerolineaceae bacterium]|nr:hypothetical protein [Anaerolineaceae bacterium]HOG77740.1 hypothetical protein [Anaerolineaceae bacterium]
MAEFNREALTQALRSINSLLDKCEKVQRKFNAGTSQHTLLKNRIEALRIASALIAREIEEQDRKANEA